MVNLSERGLVFKLDKILKKEFRTNLAFHEFSAGYGIADLVFAQNFSFSKKIIRRTPLTNFNSLNIFLTLDNRKVYELADVFDVFPHLNVAEVKKQLQFLTNQGYLEKTDRDRFRKVMEADPLNPIRKVIAVEVKLDDHRNGLIQARRYQYFADESYLAILKEAEKNIDVDEFNGHNIGLILFDSKTNSVEIRHPEPKNKICEGLVSLFAKEIMMSQYLIS